MDVDAEPTLKRARHADASNKPPELLKSLSERFASNLHVLERIIRCACEMEHDEEPELLIISTNIEAIRQEALARIKECVAFISMRRVSSKSRDYQDHFANCLNFACVNRFFAHIALQLLYKDLAFWSESAVKSFVKLARAKKTLSSASRWTRYAVDTRPLVSFARSLCLLLPEESERELAESGSTRYYPSFDYNMQQLASLGPYMSSVETLFCYKINMFSQGDAISVDLHWDQPPGQQGLVPSISRAPTASFWFPRLTSFRGVEGVAVGDQDESWEPLSSFRKPTLERLRHCTGSDDMAGYGHSKHLCHLAVGRVGTGWAGIEYLLRHRLHGKPLQTLQFVDLVSAGTIEHSHHPLVFDLLETFAPTLTRLRLDFMWFDVRAPPLLASDKEIMRTIQGPSLAARLPVLEDLQVPFFLIDLQFFRDLVERGASCPLRRLVLTKQVHVGLTPLIKHVARPWTGQVLFTQVPMLDVSGHDQIQKAASLFIQSDAYTEEAVVAVHMEIARQ